MECSNSTKQPNFDSGSFNLKHFKAITGESSYEIRLNRRNYLKNHASFLGSGTRREVYDIGNDRVLKLDQLSMEQNIKEIKASNRVASSVAFTHVLDYDPDGSWLIAEKAEQPLLPDLEKAINSVLNLPPSLLLRMETIVDFLFVTQQVQVAVFTVDELKLRAKNNNIYAKVMWLQSHPSQWLEDLLETANHCNINLKDLHTNNWGIRNSAPIVVDYGR